jgi:ribosomal 30S subunit maturation factor RimM
MGDKSMGRDMVGASVISERKQAPVGKVVDVVFSASNQPEFVVIESEGKTVAVPYSVANANMSAKKIMIDESRLQAAPKVKQGEWRSKTEGTWKKDATRYWERDQG